MIFIYSYFSYFTDDSSENTSTSQERRCSVPKKLTKSESILIETMASREQSMALTGRFLTMHKRRRKKLTTRSLSTEQAPALLDDVHHGLVQVINFLAIWIVLR